MSELRQSNHDWHSKISKKGERKERLNQCITCPNYTNRHYCESCQEMFDKLAVIWRQMKENVK